MKIWSHHQKRIETNLPNKSKRKQIDQLCLSLTAVEKNYIRRESKNAGMSMKRFVVASVERNRIIVIPGLPEVLQELNCQTEVLKQLLDQVDSNVDSGNIAAASQSCQHAYEKLVHFVDQCDVKSKRMEE